MGWYVNVQILLAWFSSPKSFALLVDFREDCVLGVFGANQKL